MKLGPAATCSVGVHKKQQLCYKGVHLLLFQKSLRRELRLRLWYVGAETCVTAVHPVWVGTYFPCQTVTSDPHRDDVVFEPQARPMLTMTLCMQFQGCSKPVSNIWWTKGQCAAMRDNNCRWTLAEGTHFMVVSMLSSRAHRFSIFLILPVVLSAL